MAGEMNSNTTAAAFFAAVDQATELELVRRGFDPAQVQHLVGSLAGELRTMASQNEQLKARVAELEQMPRSAAPTDIFEHWSTETTALMDAARASISRVTEQATADAAAAVSAGEVAANAIRQRAQLDAEALLANARKQADGTLADARDQATRTLADAEAAKAATEAEARAALERANTELAEVQGRIGELHQQRSTIKDQLLTAQTHIQQLLTLVHGHEQAESNGAEQAADVAPESAAPTHESADEQH
jgi:cell division septum initiation protein DivIVA